MSNYATRRTGAYDDTLDSRALVDQMSDGPLANNQNTGINGTPAGVDQPRTPVSVPSLEPSVPATPTRNTGLSTTAPLGTAVGRHDNSDTADSYSLPVSPTGGEGLEHTDAGTIVDPKDATTATTQDYSKGDWDAQRVMDYFASRGKTPFNNDPSYWVQKWNEFGKSDPAYFLSRIAQADEFTGVGPGYDWTKNIKKGAAPITNTAADYSSGALQGDDSEFFKQLLAQMKTGAIDNHALAQGMN